MAQTGPPFSFKKLDNVMERVRETPKLEIVIGYLPGSVHRETGVPLPMLAAIHDLGAPRANIRARPFMRQAMTNHQAEQVKALAAELRRAYAGQQSVSDAYKRVALKAETWVKQEINRPSPAFAPLKPETIKRKGSSKPLVDTGQMRDEIKAEVRPAGQTK